jgi:hypothetical protein
MMVMLLSACGGSGGTTSVSGGHLSAAAYRVHLKTVAKQSDAAEHAVEKGFQSTSVVQLVKVLVAFEAADKRIGDEVAALDAPANAESANAELAKGLHDNASELQALRPKIKKMTSAKAAVAYLTKSPPKKGGQEEDAALAQLKKLGYIKNTS